MKRIWVRPMRQADVPQFKEWVENNPSKNEWDPTIMRYPTTAVFVAHEEGRPVAYMPVQHVLMLESLARNPAPEKPDEERKKVAVALKEFVAMLQLIARQAGIGELYFCGTAPETNEYAARLFEELPWKMFRLRVDDLEKSHEDIPKSSNGLKR